MERQTLPFGKWFLDGKRKKINEEEKKKCSAVVTRIQIASDSHGEPVLTALSYVHIG